MWKKKKPSIAKTILYHKGNFGDWTIPDINLCDRATVIKTAWYWHINRQVNQWNQTEDLDINLHTYENLIFDNEAKITPLII